MLCQYRWDFSEFMPHGVFANALDAEALPLVAPVDFRMPFTACRVQSATVESKHREAGGEGVGGHKEGPHTPDFHAGANVIVGRVRVHGRLLLPRSRHRRAPGYRKRRPRPVRNTQTTTQMHAHSPQPHPSDAHCSLEARCQHCKGLQQWEEASALQICGLSGEKFWKVSALSIPYIRSV